ncbi:tripartite motif-containing protein 2-like [Ptychodera flava]|uniref:tripartite motif-containing protein 2-like n=1 Tax=Ptychodera flava TaxID=63121 RepID=UPI00396A856A
MAAASERKVLEEIGEDLLCCTICLEQFDSPKILPCLHTFCEQCLVTLIEKSGSLICPECREPCKVPDGGAPAIKSNFFMKNLIEIFRQRLKSMKGGEIKCEACQENTATHRCVECKHYLCNICVKAHRNLSYTKAHQVMTIEEYNRAKSVSPRTLQEVEYCSIHTKNEIEFYCETCQVPVCTNCAIVKHRIPEHEHRDLKDAADEYLTELKAMVDKLKVKEQEAEKNKILAKQMHSDLTEQCSREKRRVRMKTAETIKAIKREEQRLIDELENKYEMKIKGTNGDIDEMELVQGDIKSACSYIETLMHHGNAAQLLSSKGDVDKYIGQLSTMESGIKADNSKGIIFTPAEFCECGILGLLESKYETQIAKRATGNIPKQQKGDSADLQSRTRDTTGQKVIPKQQVESMSAEEDIYSSENRDVTHTVTKTGRLDSYQSTTKKGEQVIQRYPIMKGLVKTIGSKGSAEGQYTSPLGVAINNDRDIVTADAENNRLQITTADGQFKKVLKFEEFEEPFRPCDIAIASDNTYYNLDENNKQVVVTDEYGQVMRCFGQNELRSTYGIGISSLNGHVYVTDHSGQCIRTYTQHGIYLGSFRPKRKGQIILNWPWGVVIGSTGMVCVADYNNKCIQVFNEQNKYLYSFDCKCGDGQLRHPRGIAIENDKYVYVTCYPACLLKFEVSGKFVCRIDSDLDGLDWPTGLALTDDVPCRVIVADRGNNCIKVFAQ